MSRDTTSLGRVATPEMGGVTLRRHILDREAAGVAKIAQRVGNRLRVWIRQLPEGQLPSAEFNESFRWYAWAILGLLKEQRERSKYTNGLQLLTDEAYADDMRELAAEAIRSLSEPELQAMLEARVRALTPRETPGLYEAQGLPEPEKPK